MSVTTTANSGVSRTLEILGDYELHHSKSTDSGTSSPSSTYPISLNPRATPKPSVQDQSPTDWPSDQRRIPPHRPIDRHLDYEQRPAGLDGAEYVFIQTMLQGVRLNANIARLWRHTGGKINDRIFRYDIGGEW